MTLRELPYGRALLWIAGTFLVLLLALWLTAQWVPIEFAQQGKNPVVAANLPANPEIRVCLDRWVGPCCG